jgi:hypothetical protein
MALPSSAEASVTSPSGGDDPQSTTTGAPTGTGTESRTKVTSGPSSTGELFVSQAGNREMEVNKSLGKVAGIKWRNDKSSTQCMDSRNGKYAHTPPRPIRLPLLNLFPLHLQLLIQHVHRRQSWHRRRRRLLHPPPHRHHPASSPPKAPCASLHPTPNLEPLFPSPRRSTYGTNPLLRPRTLQPSSNTAGQYSLRFEKGRRIPRRGKSTHGRHREEGSRQEGC